MKAPLHTRRWPTALVVLAACCLLLQAMGASIWATAFYTNRSLFAANCENKARPALACGGRCQLMKKMKASKTENDDRPEKAASKCFQVLSSKTFFTTGISAPALLTSARQHSSFCLVASPCDRQYALLRPPAVFSWA